MSKITETVTQLAARLLDGKSEPAKIKDAIAQVQTRSREAVARLEEIRALPMRGPERVRIIREGSPEDLVALDHELEVLEAEMVQLDASEAELHEEYARALIRTYPAAARKAVKAIPKALDDLEAAEAVIERATSEIRERLSAVTLAVKHAREEGPYLDDALFERIWSRFLLRYPVRTGTDSRTNARLRHGLADDTPQPVRGRFPGKPEVEPFEKDGRKPGREGRRPPSEYWSTRDPMDAS